MKHNWTEYLPVPITICDKDGIILYMNPASIENFKKDGGKELIGKNLLDCHPESSKSMLKNMLLEEKGHTYVSEKNGVRKFIHDVPWVENGNFRGLMELIIPLSGSVKI